MSIYRPAETPMVMRIPEQLCKCCSTTGQIPESLWRDNELRHGMVRAVQASREDIQLITKALTEAELIPLHSARLEFPFSLPSAVYSPGCLSDQQERENRLLKAFAFDAYDALLKHFKDEPWFDWFVAPYFAAGDDAQTTFNIGVFTDGCSLLNY